MVWTLAGMVIGALIGLMIGGVGIAALGEARGFPAFVLLGILGAAIGYHFGRVRDLRAPR